MVDERIARHMTGTTRRRISRKNLSKVEIPLPPLAEQKRIARILDAADALRAKRREALAQLDTLLQSTFLDMFGDPVTNPMGWEREPVGEVIRVRSGDGLLLQGHGSRWQPLPSLRRQCEISGYHDSFMLKEG